MRFDIDRFGSNVAESSVTRRRPPEGGRDARFFRRRVAG
ncbi:hypothetical protein SALB1_0936 [Salinisphaera sp. LB1]|nr:hypothetical protein SALB1_0936 [Salinisphaera sp. LB1]